MTTKVTTICAKPADAKCPLCQLNDDGSRRCAGCIFQRLHFDQLGLQHNDFPPFFEHIVERLKEI